MQITTETGHRTRLTRLDTMIFEQHLKETVHAIVPFESHSIIFPRKDGASTASWSKAEKRLLLPIPGHDGETLGIFVARGVDAALAKQVIHLWDGISLVISDNLLYFKRSLCEPVTGLYSRHYLLSVIERDLEARREPRGQAPAPSMDQHFSGALASDEEAAVAVPKGKVTSAVDGGSTLSRHGSIAMLVIRLAALRDVVREFGYQFADSLMVALADTLKEHCPEQSLAARTGDLEFAIVLRATTRNACTKLANSLAEALGKVYVEHPLRCERVGILASIGYSLNPQDMAGPSFIKPVAEQARLLLRNARLAAALAGEEGHDWGGARRVMWFGHILAEGGRVVNVLPLSRVVVSLGSSMNAREGQRFSIWSVQYSSGNGEGHTSQTPLYKGEVALMEVLANSSLAEVIHLGDPTWNIEPGDRLVLVPEEQGGSQRTADGVVRLDPVTGFLRYGDFLAQWAQARDKGDSFILSLARITPADTLSDALADAMPRDDAEAARAVAQDDLQETGFAGRLSQHPDQIMSEVASLFREAFGKDVLAGRYGLNSLILYHERLTSKKVTKAYEKLASLLKKRLQLDLAVGLAPHPFLDFRKADSLENCQKALEYGLLLPEPHIGLLDSLALNISADKRFSLGDTFGAIKEYQTALLVDDKNGIAWNSLGICFASLGKHSEAKEYFSKALNCGTKDPMALYNLGYIYQSRGQQKKALEYFNKCLKLSPDHLFALVRLGQLAEHDGNPDVARSFYEKAAQQPGGETLTYRHFARLSLEAGKEDEAREYLHSALLHDPQDAFSLQLLAGIYLDAGEDPDMAASLARQCVSLRPELKAGWMVLSRALEALGKTDQARDARLKAGQVT